jgi:hypothetical protein
MIPSTAVSSARTFISYPTYPASPAFLSSEVRATLRSRPEATPTVGSAKHATSGFRASGRMRMEASVLTMMSPVSRAAAAFSPAVLPPRTGMRSSSTPRSAYRRTMSSVPSLDASDTTRICLQSAG